VDPREARAVPAERILGTLPERIYWLFLVSKLKMRTPGDFDFQSSLEGGRMEYGGLVADFLFPWLKVIVQVQGPTHSLFRRKAKDAEQFGILRELGYTVLYLEEHTCYSAIALENWQRRNFNMTGVGVNISPYEMSESTRLDWYLTRDINRIVKQVEEKWTPIAA
jgi:very-short-patch-repair endonuclease